MRGRNRRRRGIRVGAPLRLRPWESAKVQKWRSRCRVTGVRPIRVSGVGCSGDGREARGKRQCKSANRSDAPVQRWKSEYKKGTGGKGDEGAREGGERQEAVQRWKGDEAGDGGRGKRGSGNVQRCKRAKVEGIRGRVDKWDGGQGEARGSAKVQIATESLCKGGNVQR